MTGKKHLLERHAIRRAEGYLELEMPQHALRALEPLRYPTDYDAHACYLKGIALRGMDRFEDALVPLTRAAKLRGGSTHVWLALGWCHKRTGRVDLAVQDLENALDQEPDSALIHYNLACYLSLLGNKPRALTHLSRALTIDPGYRDLVDDESDFDPIRSDPGFRSLTSAIV